jgi:DNA sulfur modification protein DndE
MFNQIKTSSQNKPIVTDLTRKFGLGAENVIARIAIAYSLHSGSRFSPLDIKDSGGKEYSKNVLFGSLYKTYLHILCTAYNITETDRDIPRYFKLHLDHGLELINEDIKQNPNLVGFDYLFDKIRIGLNEI